MKYMCICQVVQGAMLQISCTNKSIGGPDSIFLIKWKYLLIRGYILDLHAWDFKNKGLTTFVWPLYFLADPGEPRGCSLNTIVQ